MKKYTTLPIDYTTLISEITAYAQSIGHGQNGWFLIKTTPKQIPSLSIFTNINLSIYGFGCATHVAPDVEQTDPGVFQLCSLMIPLTDDPCSITFYDPLDGASIVNTYFYPEQECIKGETVAVTEPLLINRDVPFILKTDDSSKSVPYILFIFDGIKLSTLFAE